MCFKVRPVPMMAFTSFTWTLGFDGTLEERRAARIVDQGVDLAVDSAEILTDVWALGACNPVHPRRRPPPTSIVASLASQCEA